MDENHKILKKRDELLGKRSNWETHWQDVADYVMPKKNNITVTETPGQKRNLHLYDGTAIRANVLLSAGLHSTLTNPAVKFFDLTTGDKELDDNDRVRGWLQMTSDDIYNVIVNSNFQTEVHELYLDLGCFGTAPMFIDEHDEKVINFMSYPVADVIIGENTQGMVDEIYREFHWTAAKIVQEFGENVPQMILDHMRQADHERKFKIVHAIIPRKPGMGVNLNSKFTYISKYILDEERSKETLSEGGFREFPYVSPRWEKDSVEMYGRSPAMEILPDIRTLNAMVKTFLKGAQKMVDPPLQVPDDGLLRKINLTPGAVNRRRNGADRIEPILTGGRLDIGQEIISLWRDEIKKGFFLDLFRTETGDRATAFEIQQKTQEQLKMLGPILGRMHSEFLRPMINRVYNIMDRKGLIEPAPDELEGRAFEAIFSSPLAKAQKSVDAEGVIRGVQSIAFLGEIDQGVFDNINADKAARFVLKQGGLPQDLMRDEDDIKKMRAARDEANRQMIEQQQQQQQAEMVAKVGPAAAQLQRAGNETRG